VWNLKPVGGRDYFPLLNCEYEFARRPKGGCNDSALLNEAAPLIQSRGTVLKDASSCRPSAAYGSRVERTPEAERVKKPYTIEEALGEIRCDFINDPTEKDKPFFIQFSNDRPSYLLDKEYPFADKDSYRRFCAEHPNYLGVFTLGEFDQQLEGYALQMPKSEDKELVKEIHDRVPWPAAAKRPWGSGNDWPLRRILHTWWPKWAKDAYERAKAFHFGEERIWSLNSGTVTLSLAMAEIGCNGVAYEATTQGAGDWQIALAATRGASRQFDIPFGWYTANFYTGYTRDGKRTSGENSTVGTNRFYRAFGPDRGASPSLLRRQSSFGWLGGAAFQDTENWYSYYFDPKDKMPNGAQRLSEFGRDFDALYRNSKKIGRGVPYTPLAVLVPVFDQYNASMFARDHAMDPWLATTVFLTLDDRRFGNADDARKDGTEGCLYNSPYGSIYDILAPDAARSRDRMGSVLASYKVAIVAGRFEKDELSSGLFRNYVSAGGTLIVSSEKIGEGIVDEALTGVAFTKEKVKFGARLIEAATQYEAAALTQEYQVFKPNGTAAAKPYYVDGNGAAIVYVHKVGLGRVVTVACERMLPEILRKCQHHEYRDRHNEVLAGKLPLELMSTLMGRVSRETMPVHVEGDVQWGVNKVKSKKGKGKSEEGWLVWLFNNKGVIKYIGEKQVCDPAATARAVVRFGSQAKTIDVPAGEARLYETATGHIIDPNQNPNHG